VKREKIRKRKKKKEISKRISYFFLNYYFLFFFWFSCIFCRRDLILLPFSFISFLFCDIAICTFHILPFFPIFFYFLVSSPFDSTISSSHEFLLFFQFIIVPFLHPFAFLISCFLVFVFTLIFFFSLYHLFIALSLSLSLISF